MSEITIETAVESAVETPVEAAVETTGPELRLPRCCPAHGDWPTLAQHLLDEFSEISISVLIREVRRARDAATSVGLPDEDALEIGELIVRHQLWLISGRAPDSARLDPERHPQGRGRN